MCLSALKLNVSKFYNPRDPLATPTFRSLGVHPACAQ